MMTYSTANRNDDVWVQEYHEWRKTQESLEPVEVILTLTDEEIDELMNGVDDLYLELVGS